MRAGLRAHELGRIGVALLRHDRGAGGELVRQPHQAGERRGPDHDLFGEPRQMHRADRRGGERLHHEVAVGHGVERIRGRPVEAERLRGHLAVERKRRAGERRGAERAFIQPLARIGEAAAVARRHLDESEKMMAEGDRLRGLQMRQPRHDRVGMFQRLLGERRLVIGKRDIELVDGVAHPEPEIGRDLIVARARGMQAAGGRADQSRRAAIPRSCARLPARAGS